MAFILSRWCVLTNESLYFDGEPGRGQALLDLLIMSIDPEYIPGTEKIVTGDNKGGISLLKDDDVVLLPAPTLSPNDPLNWSRWRKYWNAFILLAFRGLGSACSNAGFAPAPVLVEKLGFTYAVFDNMAAVVFACMGAWLFLSAPSIFLYGGRLQYLFGAVCGIIGMAWFANVSHARDIYGSQFFLGISVSCTEAPVILAFSQVFFQHQIDSLIAIYVLASLVGMFCGPLIAGYDVSERGWEWDGYAGLISYAIILILVAFGLEETYFDRNYFSSRSLMDIQPGDDGKNGNTNTNFNSEMKLSKSTNQYNAPDEDKRDALLESDNIKSYWQRIALITPASNLRGTGFRQYVDRLWLLLRVFTFPPVIFAGIQWAMQMSWVTYYMTLESNYWTESPWNYSTSSVGIMFVPTLIGALVGFIYSFWAVKWFVKRMAHRNGGVMEAEVRLWCLIPGIMSSTVGLIVLGVGTEQMWAWPVPYVMLGFIGFGFGSLGDISMAYCVDCYPDLVLETMVAVAFIFDIICAVLSVVCSYWLSIGPQNTFISVGMVNLFFCLWAVPMIYFGKRCRKWTRETYFELVKKRDSYNG